MNRYRKFAALLLVLVWAGVLLPIRSFAAGELDPGADIGLTVSCQDEAGAIAGAGFELYLVAEMDDAGALSVTGDFAGLPVKIQPEDEASFKALASTLEGYVLRDGIVPTDQGVTNENGILSFPTGEVRLAPGLYLVLGGRHTQGESSYDFSPFVVVLPGQEHSTGEWEYQVSVKPKFDKLPANFKPVSRRVLKVWKDNGYERRRPREITVQLLCDGEVYDTVTLNAVTNWRYEWTELPAENRWTVVEEQPGDYTVEVSREGITFVVTNTYTKHTPDNPGSPGGPGDSDGPDTPSNPGNPGNPSDSDEPGTPTFDIPDALTPLASIFPELVPLAMLPQTGQLWWPVPYLMAMGLLMIVVGLFRRRGA